MILKMAEDLPKKSHPPPSPKDLFRSLLWGRELRDQIKSNLLGKLRFHVVLEFNKEKPQSFS